MVATKANLIFTNEQGNQVSSIQVEKVYMGYPLKAALKNLLKEEFTLDSIHLPNRSSTFYLSHEYCPPHYFHCQLFENKCNRESQCQRVNSPLFEYQPHSPPPGTHTVLQESLVAQTVKCLSTLRETWVQSLGWEDSLEKETATHSSILA